MLLLLSVLRCVCRCDNLKNSPSLADPVQVSQCITNAGRPGEISAYSAMCVQFDQSDSVGFNFDNLKTSHFRFPLRCVVVLDFRSVVLVSEIASPVLDYFLKK